MCNNYFLGRIEGHSFTFDYPGFIRIAALGHLVKPQNHVLRRNGNRRAVSRVQDVVRCKHQYLGLQDGRIAEWQMHRHLVTVKVGVECRTYQWVKLNGLTFHQCWLESLDTQTVQRWCPVK